MTFLVYIPQRFTETKVYFNNRYISGESMRSKREEIRRRFPRITMNLLMTLIFWIISAFVPQTLTGIIIPGFDFNASLLVWIISSVVMAIFLIRALSDALVLGDIVTDVVVRKLGIKEEMSPKRAARDLIYIIIIVLVVTAVSPVLSTIENIGGTLSTAATYMALGLIIVLIYDMGRVLYRIVENKAELLADRLAGTIDDNEKCD